MVVSEVFQTCWETEIASWGRSCTASATTPWRSALFTLLSTSAFNLSISAFRITISASFLLSNFLTMSRTSCLERQFSPRVRGRRRVVRTRRGSILRSYWRQEVRTHLPYGAQGHSCSHSSSQTCKMPEILPGQDFSFSDFTQKCVNYANLKTATKQRNLSSITLYTTMTSLNNALPRPSYPTQAG